MKAKEFFYIGYYRECMGRYVIKIGTTKDLEQRRKQHNKYYTKTKNYPLGENSEFKYVFKLPLSKYNTLRIEDETRERFKNMEIGTFVRNDRFICDELPKELTIFVRKEHKIEF